jgi:hypothetical protein
MTIDTIAITRGAVESIAHQEKDILLRPDEQALAIETAGEARTARSRKKSTIGCARSAPLQGSKLFD